jgi:hypothetical protein
VWWYIPIILAFRGLRQKDFKFEASMGYITGNNRSKKQENYVS